MRATPLRSNGEDAKNSGVLPFPEIRPAQEKALAAIERAYRARKKFVVLKIPTGGGKLGIAVAAAQWAEVVIAKGAYILSPQKTLTSQYATDFARLGIRSSFATALSGRDRTLSFPNLGQALAFSGVRYWSSGGWTALYSGLTHQFSIESHLPNGWSPMVGITKRSRARVEAT